MRSSKKPEAITDDEVLQTAWLLSGEITCRRIDISMPRYLSILLLSRVDPRIARRLQQEQERIRDGQQRLQYLMRVLLK